MHESGPVDEQIRAALLRETDPDRTAVLKKIAKHVCSCSE